MKTLKNLKFLSLILFTSGLMSCTEHSETSPTPLKVADGFALKDLKGEVHNQINPLETSQSLMTQITLTSQGQPVVDKREVNMTVKSYCTSNDRQVTKTLQTSLRTVYPFFELVPEELLLGSVQDPQLWLCNFEFTAVDNLQNKHIFDIKNIPLKNTADGFNSNVLKDSVRTHILDGEQSLVVRESELHTFTVVSDSVQADEMTLHCRDFKWPMLHKNTNAQALNQLERRALSSEALPQNPIQFCRVNLYQDDRLVGLSPLLEIIFDSVLQDGAVETSVHSPSHYSWSWEARPHTPLHFWSVKIKNTSSYVRQFQLDFSQVQSAHVTFIDRYPRRSPWHSQKLEAQLTLPAEAKILSESFQNWSVELAPGHEAEVNLYLRFSHVCGTDHQSGFFDYATLVRAAVQPTLSQIVRLEKGVNLPLQTYEANFPEIFIRNAIPAQWDQNAAYNNYLDFHKLTEFPTGCEIRPL